MSTELVAVLIGGALAIVGSLATTYIFNVSELQRRARSIRSLAVAEVTAIQEKAQRYVDDISTKEEVVASTPMLTSIASELGYLDSKQVISYRRILTLDMEMRKGMRTEKARATIVACQEAKRHFPGEF